MCVGAGEVVPTGRRRDASGRRIWANKSTGERLRRKQRRRGPAAVTHGSALSFSRKTSPRGRCRPAGETLPCPRWIADLRSATPFTIGEGGPAGKNCFLVCLCIYQRLHGRGPRKPLGGCEDLPWTKDARKTSQQPQTAYETRSARAHINAWNNEGRVRAKNADVWPAAHGEAPELEKIKKGRGAPSRRRRPLNFEAAKRDQIVRGQSRLARAARGWKMGNTQGLWAPPTDMAPTAQGPGSAHVGGRPADLDVEGLPEKCWACTCFSACGTGKAHQRRRAGIGGKGPRGGNESLD
jgi:hypothetical protein